MNEVNELEESMLAPIVLFTYNRPIHTEKTLLALKSNILAKYSTLYIYCDGQKKDADSEQRNKITEVRSILKQEQWCKHVVIIESPVNKGLANSIKDGVTEIIQKYGKVIVLEDDLVTSPAFLTYMNKALCKYEPRKTVFSISGYNLPGYKLEIPSDYEFDVFVSLRNGSWGWATWIDRWAQVDWDVSNYDRMLTIPQIQESFNRSGDDVFPMLQSQQKGKLNIWSIQFTVAHFENHAVSIVPTVSYVNNIGLDGTGENCLSTSSLDNRTLNEKVDIKFLDILYEDKRIINSHYNVYCKRKRPLWQKFINRLSRLAGRNNIFTIKRKIYY